MKNEQQNEGEGNKTAARRYNQEATKSAREGRGARKGREAAKDLDGPGADRSAESIGREPARGVEER